MDITDGLTIAAAILVFIIIILGFVYYYMSLKEKREKQSKERSIYGKKDETKENTVRTYTQVPVFDFMQFDNIRDNMILQDNGKRYLMVIECEGINYDLMSEVEKAAVEQGFVSFLNTLRHPIQLYVQTRTINISSSIENYNKELDKIKQDLLNSQNNYNRAIQEEVTDQKVLTKLKMEMARNQNLYDYGKDIISNTEKMSLNKNVLRKHYYIVVPYNDIELGVDMQDEEEKINMIFSELYTRAQTIIRTLFACNMKGRVLDSNELADLLYVAYNREDAEIYGIDKAIKAGFTELYSTAPDVLDKKMKALDNKINQKAMEKAKEAVDEVRTEKEKAIEEKEENIDELIDKLAKIIINENENYIGKEVAEKAINKIDNTKEKEEIANEKKTKSRRTTK